MHVKGAGGSGNLSLSCPPKSCIAYLNGDDAATTNATGYSIAAGHGIPFISEVYAVTVGVPDTYGTTSFLEFILNRLCWYWFCKFHNQDNNSSRATL